MTTRYDIELFRSLNNEYTDRRLVPAPRTTNQKSLTAQARARASGMDRRIGLTGQRVLEIGAGRGHFCDVLASDYGCEVVGVDIVEYETWHEFSSGCELRVHDITRDELASLGTFDRIVSYAVFEHVERPYEGLEAMHRLLRPGGVAYMSANLYRGPKASHRYREVFFPFPHLLFDDEVFAQFYEPTTRPHRAAAWVNKLTAAQYREKVRELGFDIRQEWMDRTVLDRDFYERFHDVLGRYPTDDLETDFIHLILTRPSEFEMRAQSARRRVRARWSRSEQTARQLMRWIRRRLR